MAYKIIDFADIIADIMENLKVQDGDTTTKNRIKRTINKVYLQEVIPFSRWKWLEGTTRVVHKARYNDSTCSVAPNSATVTLATAPSASLGSFTGKKFAVDGYNEVYIISAHTAGSTTVTLTSNYTGNLSTTAGFKIWTDVVILPTDCRETINVWHNFHAKPMEGIGLQKIRSLAALNQRQEAYPSFYYTGSQTDPTPTLQTHTSTTDTDTNTYRTMYIYPSINRTDCTLQIDYVKEVAALDLDGDEPLIPIEDRSVLVDGALARLWKSVASDNENAQLSKQDFEQKLARMAGKTEDSIDTPKFTPTSTYVRSRRASRFGMPSSALSGTSGGSGYTAITYLENPTIKGANITDNVTISSGKTIDGVDISVLKADFDAHIVDTIDAHDASAISSIAAGNLSSTDVQSALNELDTEKAIGAASSTDNAVVRFDSTTGKLIQDTSGVTIDDSFNITQGGTIFGVLTSATLTNNTASPTSCLSITLASATACFIEATITRSTIVEILHIYMMSDSTSTFVSPVGTNNGSNGVSFTGDVSGGSMRLLYTTTNTGTNASMKYIVRKWLA